MIKRLNSEISVDGYDKITRTAYEFYGCYYHGHSCITQRRDQVIDEEGRSINSRYDTTLAREEFLRNICNVKVVSICASCLIKEKLCHSGYL